MNKNIEILKLKFYSIKKINWFINLYKAIIGLVTACSYMERLPSPKGTTEGYTNGYYLVKDKSQIALSGERQKSDSLDKNVFTIGLLIAFSYQ